MPPADNANALDTFAKCGMAVLVLGYTLVKK
jgi:hypothetical protein